MPELYSKDRVEAALVACGWAILQQDKSGLVMYQTNFSPGGDLVIDWGRDSCSWEVIKMQLDDFGIDHNCILDKLADTPEM